MGEAKLPGWTFKSGQDLDGRKEGRRVPPGGGQQREDGVGECSFRQRWAPTRQL